MKLGIGITNIWSYVSGATQLFILCEIVILTVKYRLGLLLKCCECLVGDLTVVKFCALVIDLFF